MLKQTRVSSSLYSSAWHILDTQYKLAELVLTEREGMMVAGTTFFGQNAAKLEVIILECGERVRPGVSAGVALLNKVYKVIK